MNYQEDTGTVVDLHDGKATVRLDHECKELCHKGCACSMMGSDGRNVDVAADDLSKGDRVRVHIPIVNEYLSMFFVFGLPLLLTAAGLFIGSRLEGEESGGGLTLAGGAIGLVAGMVVAWVANGVAARDATPMAERIQA